MLLGDAFTGYGGLGHAVQTLYDAQLAWTADTDPAASRLLRWQHPHVPNHGDMTRIDWRAVQPVDILCAGTPCQDLSHAGPRRGLGPGTRSGLWHTLLDAIETMRPSLLVWENVVGAYSACAATALEPCPRCVGGSGPHQPRLRALGRVVGDLSSLRYDCRWHRVRASDIGAPHRRARVFLLAYPRQTTPQPLPAAPQPTSLLTRGLPTPRVTDGTSGPGHHGDGGLDLRTAATSLPTPTTQDAANNASRSQTSRKTPPLAALLPTPSVTDMGEGKDADEWAAWTAAMEARHHNTNGHGRSLAVEAHDWGHYAAAITRWEHATRPHPPPLEQGPDGPRLAAVFTEWMMGVEPGWVTAVPGLSRKAQMRLLGNGVVPQQAAHAIRTLTTWKAPA